MLAEDLRKLKLPRNDVVDAAQLRTTPRKAEAPFIRGFEQVEEDSGR
jgi:hypothetical protein